MYNQYTFVPDYSVDKCRNDKPVKLWEGLGSPVCRRSARISQPCWISLFLSLCEKPAFLTVGVLGVPTSFRDLRTLDLGVSAILSANLALVGVGGHFKSLNPSLFLSWFTWSMFVPNTNWRSGVQTLIGREEWAGFQYMYKDFWLPVSSTKNTSVLKTQLGTNLIKKLCYLWAQDANQMPPGSKPCSFHC